MEALGMPTFDELADANPTNLKIAKVEELRDQSIDMIQNVLGRYLFIQICS